MNKFKSMSQFKMQSQKIIVIRWVIQYDRFFFGSLLITCHCQINILFILTYVFTNADNCVMVFFK